MSKFSPVSRKEFVNRIREFGFDGPYPGGRHEFMVRGQLRLTIPNPHQGDYWTQAARSHIATSTHFPQRVGKRKKMMSYKNGRPKASRFFVTNETGVSYFLRSLGWIAFTSFRDGNNEIYIMHPDGSGQTRLTNNSIADWQPRWGK